MGKNNKQKEIGFDESFRVPEDAIRIICLIRVAPKALSFPFFN